MVDFAFLLEAFLVDFAFLLEAFLVDFAFLLEAFAFLFDDFFAPLDDFFDDAGFFFALLDDFFDDVGFFFALPDDFDFFAFCDLPPPFLRDAAVSLSASCKNETEATSCKAFGSKKLLSADLAAR